MLSKDKKLISGMFDEISPTYDLLNHMFSGYQDKLWRKQAVKHLIKNNVKARNILDIASGSGDLAVEFLAMNPEKIFSVDISSGMLKINRSKLNSRTCKNIPIAAEAARLPFADQYFDIAGIAFGIRNFDQLDKCMTEIHRVLKPGARFVVIEMFSNRSNSIGMRLFKVYFNKIVPKVGSLISKSSYAYNYLFNSVESFITVEEFSDMLNNSGFIVEKRKNNFMGIVNTVISRKI